MVKEERCSYESFWVIAGSGQTWSSRLLDQQNDGGKNASCSPGIVVKLLPSSGIAETATFLMNTGNTLLESYQQRLFENTLTTGNSQIQQADNLTLDGVISTDTVHGNDDILFP